MRRPMTLGLLLAVVAASLAAPQMCNNYGNCLTSNLYNQGTAQSTNFNAVAEVQVTDIEMRASGTEGNCECVFFYLCGNSGLITDGTGVLDIRHGNSCGNYSQICCNSSNILPDEEKITPRPRIRRGCGQRNPTGIGVRITGNFDNEAQFGEFPWMVAIISQESINAGTGSSTLYRCGGSLIHWRAVLTAAHCINGTEPSKLLIRAGEWDTQNNHEIFPHQNRRVETVIVHEKFHPRALRNDIAILILKKPVKQDENVDVVCLPQPNENFDRNRCFASGWGKDKFGHEGYYQVILKSISLPIVPRNECQTTLRNTTLGRWFLLHKSFICAGGEIGKDTCKGDGGGPLVCPLKNDPTRYAQAGIVSWGMGCGENQVPGVYANVAALRQWINVQMTSHALELEA